MKLEEGMYVRTKKGIMKLNKIDDNDNKWKYIFKVCHEGIFEYGTLREEDILKASHNIIDLIEVGDYVNGERVIKIENGWIHFADGQCNFIETIVTKEQFESMCYKL